MTSVAKQRGVGAAKSVNKRLLLFLLGAASAYRKEAKGAGSLSLTSVVVDVRDKHLLALLGDGQLYNDLHHTTVWKVGRV